MGVTIAININVTVTLSIGVTIHAYINGTEIVH